ncbi:cadherin-23-like [Glandiceps talaboti]
MTSERLLIFGLLLACIVPLSYQAAPVFNFVSGTTISILESCEPNDLVFSIGVDVTPSTIVADPALDPARFTLTPTTYDVLVGSAGFDYEENPALNYFTLKFKATNTGTSEQSVAWLNVIIEDVFDEPPTFGSTTYTGDIDEGSTTVHWGIVPHLDCEDLDAGDTITYQLEHVPSTDAAFQVDPTTGVITAARDLDFDGVSGDKDFELRLFAFDYHENTGSATLTISVNDLNDNYPIITPVDPIAVIEHDTDIGTVDELLEITDEDADDIVFTLAIISGDDTLNPKFFIDGSNIKNSAALDYEDPVLEARNYRYDLVVKATDPGGLTGTTTIVVQVTPDNEEPPAFDSFPAAAISIPEDSPLQTQVIASLPATDPDFGVDGEITYSLDSPNSGELYFRVIPDTGEILTIATFDYETGSTDFDLVIVIMDGGSSPLSAMDTLTVSITDVNDEAPYFEPITVTALAFNEDQTLPYDVLEFPSGTPTASVNDKDTIFNPTLTFISGNDNNIFAFDGTKLVLNSVVNLDNPDFHPSSYTLKIAVSDGIYSGTGTVLVTVNPINEHPPIFGLTDPSGTVQLDEGLAAGTLVATVSADDWDLGDTVTFSIDDPDGHFVIDSSTGQIHISSVIDYDTITDNPIDLIVKASDADYEASATVPILIRDLNDADPVCDPVTPVEISETEADGFLVASLSCSDTDVDDILSYAFSTSTTDFAINPDTGEVTVAAGNNIDYVAGPTEYNLIVEVTDGSGGLTTVGVTIRIQPQNTDVPEFIPVTWTVGPFPEDSALSLSITDASDYAEDLDAHPYNIQEFDIFKVENEAGATVTDVFDIIHSGTSMGLIMLTTPLDYESFTKYIIIVTATDTAQTASGTVTVIVEDVNEYQPACNFASEVLSIDENTAPGVIIDETTLGCTDGDLSTAFGTASLTYTLTSNPGSLFSVGNGGDISLVGSLDYELASAYEVILKVSDGGGLYREIPIYINVVNVDDSPPYFSGTFSTSIAENANVDDPVILVTAQDDDSADTPEGQVTYAIISGDPQDQFSIDKQSGQINIRSQLDREDIDSYSLEVEATDGAGGQDTVIVTITIIDVNDELPVCTVTSFTDVILETESSGYFIRSLGCTDGDIGDILTYTLTTGDTSVFGITGGNLILSSSRDYETDPTSYELEVTVVDSNGNTHIITGTVHIQAVNEVAPVFSPVPVSVYTPDILENSPTDTPVTTVVATDVDSVDFGHGVVTYVFDTPCDDCSKFQVNPVTGVIVVTNTLDRETKESYSLNVVAKDSSFSTTATVTVNVLDENDNSPLFTDAFIRTDIAEDISPPVTLITLSATDLDDPATDDNGRIRFEIASGDTDNYFRVGTFDGILKSAQKIDYETVKNFELTIRAYDKNRAAGYKEDLIEVLIEVLPKNEYSPVYGTNPIDIDVSEDADVGVSLFQVITTDDDDGLDGELYYTIPSHSKFQLEDISGNFALKTALDREVTSSYTLLMTAFDKGTSPQKSAIGTIRVTVLDVNDNTPVCSPSTVKVTLPEDTATTTIVTSLACDDLDAGPDNNRLTYTIVEEDGTASSGTIFSVDGSLGVVSLASSLDWESATDHSLVVEVKDNGAAALSTSVTIVVNVSPVNENDPIFTAPGTVTVLESDSVGFVVSTLAATPEDDDESVTYEIVTSDSRFYCDEYSGEITLLQQLDADPGPQTIVLTVRATDDGSYHAVRSTDETLTINVGDVNDNAPLFDEYSYYFTCAENAANNDVIGTVNADDIDMGVNADVEYTLNPVDSTFDVDSATGNIFVKDNVNLDTTATPSYSLTVEAVDNGATPLTGTAYVTVIITEFNDNVPTFPPPGDAHYTIEVDETEALGTVVLTALATDADAGGNDIKYSITAGDDGKFIIDEEDGSIILIDYLDYETNQSPYELTVIAVDSGTNGGRETGTATYTVSVIPINDNAPVCDKMLYSTLVGDGEPINTVIIDTTCSDGDINAPDNTLTYSVLSGGGGAIDIVSNADGDIIIKTALDFTSSSSYELVVQVSDGGDPILSTTFTAIIDIDASNQEAPVMVESPYIAGIPEDSDVGTSVVKIEATDGDGGAAGIVVFDIVAGNDDGKFRINGTTGEIFLAQAVDTEVVTRYNLTVRATDRGDPPESTDVEVEIEIENVNDKVPFCDPVYYTTVVEGEATPTDLTTLSCTDNDIVTTDNDLKYYIIGGDPDMEFQIDETSGIVQNALALDLEKQEFYKLIIGIEDEGMEILTGTATVNVQVTGINDNNPVFDPITQSKTVFEDVPVGESIYTVLATDADLHQDGSLMFEILSGNDDNIFGINSANGKIYLANNLDRESVDVHTLIIWVSDLATVIDDRLTTTGTVIISVEDVNDEAPICDPVDPVFSVSENAIPNFKVDDINCTDADILGFNGDFTLEILSGNIGDIFYLHTNQLLVKQSPDYEVRQKYTLLVGLYDEGTPQQSGTATVTVSILSENEFTPEFVIPTGGYVFNVLEDMIATTVVGTVSTTDGDLGIDGTPRFYIISGNDDDLFRIDRDSGDIFTIGFLDREVTSSYELDVMVRDSQPLMASEKNATTTVLINVIDVNDNVPQFSHSSLILTVLEGLAPGIVIQTVSFTDRDEGSNAEFDFEIVSGNTGFTFDFDGYNLIVNKRIDLAVASSYNLIVNATDHGTYPGPLSSTGIIIIHVKSINEYTPSFGITNDFMLIPENTAIGAKIYQATADDFDVGCHGELKYIIGGIEPIEDADSFNVNEITGEVLLASYLDREWIDTYKVNLTAIDDSCNGTDIRAGSMILNIRVTDINDEEPYFSKLSGYTFYVNENIPLDTMIGRVFAADDDDGTNADIIFTIDEASIVDTFRVDEDGGGITTIKDLDHETQPAYSFLVRATDKGDPPRSSVTNVIINVLDLNDNQPIIDPDIMHVAFYENQEEGLLITPVDAYDIDETSNGEFTYEIVSGDINGAFRIDPMTGSLYTSNIPMDRENIPLYELMIRTTDNGDPALSYTASVTVSVLDENDNDPVLQEVFLEDTVLENIGVGTSIFNIRGSDSDIHSNANLTYTIDYGNTESEFSIDLLTGVIRLAQPLNRENVDEYSLHILVEDQGVDHDGLPDIRSATAQVNIFVGDVNDVPPRFTPRSYNFPIEEHSSAGILLGSVYAEDQDLGTNADFEFSVVSGNGLGKFSVNSQTGAVTVLVSNLDREEQGAYQFRVRVQDNGDPPLYSDATVSISVTDLNDHQPEFTRPFYEGEVVENAALGTSVLKVFATDADIGNNAALTYTIDSTDTEANTYWDINSDTGVISVRQGMDYETDTEIEFDVHVQDGAEVPMANIARVIITVVDINDNGPIISPCFITNEISYRHASEKGILATFAASDQDKDNKVSFEFSPSSYMFQIGVTSGAITAIPTVDPSPDTKYVLQLLSRDDGYPQQTSDPCLCRIDSFDPNTYMISVYMSSTTQSEFESGKRSQLLSTMDGLLKGRISSARVGISHLDGGGAGTGSRRRLLAADDLTIHAYAVENADADNVYGIENKKVFLTNEYLHSVFADDIFDNPVGELKSLGVYKVHKYPGQDWYRTPEGIAGLTLGILGAIALLTLPCLCYCCCKGGACDDCCACGDDGCCGSRGRDGCCGNRSCFDRSDTRKPRATRPAAGGERNPFGRDPKKKPDDGYGNEKRNNKKGLQNNLLGPSSERPSTKGGFGGTGGVRPSGGAGATKPSGIGGTGATKPSGFGGTGAAKPSGKPSNSNPTVGGGNPNANPNIGVLGYPGLSVGPNKFRQAAEQAATKSNDPTAKGIAQRAPPPSGTGGGGAGAGGAGGGGSLLAPGGGKPGGDSAPKVPDSALDGGRKSWRGK